MQFTRRQVCASLGAMFVLPSCNAGTAPPSPAITLDPATSAFLDAVRTGNAARVKAMLDDSPALANSLDDQGCSALTLAFLHGHEPVADLLIANATDLDAFDAVLAQDWPRFEQLAKRSPEDMLRAYPFGGTPLHAGAIMGSISFWRMRGAGCLPDARPDGGNGFTAARTAMDSPHAHWARISLADLCSNGADVNAKQKHGSTVLHGAIAHRDEALLRLAIRKGANPDAKDDNGRTPAQLAAHTGWQQGTNLLAGHANWPRDNRGSRFLLDANQQPIVRPDLSDVPQELQGQVTGASHTNLKKVRQLVATDARLVFSISTDAELAIEASAHLGNQDLMKFHLDHGAPLSLPTAVSMNNHEAIRFWLERDPTLLHERGAHDFPLMFYVVFGGGSIATAELLKSSGADLDQDSVGTTALHWCVARNNTKLARWLIENGANLEPAGYRSNRAGETPLQAAIAHQDNKMVALLKDAGARK